MIEFVTKEDLARVMQRGLWTYRGDALVLKQLYRQPDLTKPLVTHMKIWTQWHCIPLVQSQMKGLPRLRRKKIGTPLSEATHIFANGMSFYKIKLLVEIDKKLKGSLEVTHPTLGDFEIFLVYENLNRVCLFSGKVGH